MSATPSESVLNNVEQAYQVYLQTGYTCYLTSCDIVNNDTNIIDRTAVASAASKQCAEDIFLEARTLNQTIQPISSNENLEEIIKTEIHTLLHSSEENTLIHARARLYCVASLLEMVAANFAYRSVYFIQQMLIIDIQRMNALKEAFANPNVTHEHRNQACAEHTRLTSVGQQQEYENLEKQGKKLHDYGMFCHQRSKLVIHFTHKPEIFESLSNIFQGMNQIIR